MNDAATITLSIAFAAFACASAMKARAYSLVFRRVGDPVALYQSQSWFLAAIVCDVLAVSLGVVGVR